MVATSDTRGASDGLCLHTYMNKGQGKREREREREKAKEQEKERKSEQDRAIERAR